MITKWALLPLLTFTLCAAAIPLAHAEDSANDNKDFVTVLTEDNIRAFLEESRQLAGDMNFGMDTAKITGYFQKHLAEKGSFRSLTRYELPGYPPQEGEMVLNKEEYISNISQGQNLLEDYSSSIEMKDLKISDSGRSATLHTKTVEKGKLLWPDQDGVKKPVPIEGVSECEQKLVVSLNNYIQIAEDNCTTVIGFQPFGDKPLGE